MAKPTDWQFVYFDDADAAGALGYHDLTQDGQPPCIVLFEMVIDPIANLWAKAGDGTEYAYEMCDAVEEDAFLVDGIEMSNFLHPAWFEPFKHPPGTKFDHLGLLTKPFTLRKGGYLIIKRKGKVSQVFGSAAKVKRFAATAPNTAKPRRVGSKKRRSDRTPSIPLAPDRGEGQG